MSHEKETPIIMIRALPTGPSPLFTCISTTGPWRELEWGRVLVVSPRRLFLICTKLLGKAAKRWPNKRAVQGAGDLIFQRK